MVKLAHTSNSTYLQLLPNCSATWRQTKWAIAVVALTTLAVATVWSLLGFWLILPIAGFEVALFAYLSYSVCSANHHRQVVIFSEDKVEVQWGQREPKRFWRFNRRDTQLHVVRPHHSLSPSRLFLKDGQQCLALAENLNREDVDQAIACFRKVNVPLTYKGTTPVVAAADRLVEPQR